MTNVLNNVDLDKIAQTVAGGKQDRTTLKKPVRLQGEWNLDPAKGYQFRTEISYEKGKQVIEIDTPSFMGGSGNRLGPMAYCIAGETSCFSATFAHIAAEQGIRLTKLTVDAQCSINWAKPLDIADEPINDVISFQIDAQSDNADKQRLQEIVKLATERCPALYIMTHVLKVDARIK
jgi:uncharacterized OsmC-like protein